MSHSGYGCLDRGDVRANLEACVQSGNDLLIGLQ